MSDSITGAGNTVINNYYGSEDSGSTDTAADQAPDSISSDALAEYLESALEDGKFSKAEQKVAEGLAEATGEMDGADSESGTDGASDSTSEDFMSQLDDVLAQSDDPGEGEDALRAQGERLAEEGATPEQKEEFLKMAKDAMKPALDEDEGLMNEVSDEEGIKAEGFVDGLLADGSETSASTDGSDGMEDNSFMEDVDGLLDQSQGGERGSGEKKAREAALTLDNASEEAQQEFIKSLEAQLNNKDGNGDYKQDIDETNDGEGTYLQKRAEELLTSDDESSDSSESSGASEPRNNVVLFKVLEALTEDGELDAKDISALRSVLEAQPEQAAA
jgi:hypothetical protein